MRISMFDNVRIASTPLTIELGLAGIIAQVYGVTTPSVTGVDIIGTSDYDIAYNLAIEGKPYERWFAPDMVEFVDHAPGTTAGAANGKVKIRLASGEWIEKDDV